MEKATSLLVLMAVLGAVQCDYLSLTNYIDLGWTSAAKTASRVWTGDVAALGIESYSGYFTVNKTYNSNLFFWYFPALKNRADAPVVLWLQGGPGASSLYGCFMENGPVFVNENNKLQKRPQSWHVDHHVLYIDNPVGAGFSYTDNAAGYATNQNDVAANLFSAVRQFFQVFSELRNNRFYVAGESYAGKYVPAVSYAIYQKRLSADPWDRINLKGIAIGNGVTDPINQIDFGQYFYELGFIDEANLAIFNLYQGYSRSAYAQNNFTGSMLYTFALINSQNCLFNQLTGFTSPYNYLEPNGYNEFIERTGNYLANSTIRNHLHVGSKPFVAFTDTNLVLANLVGDIMQTVAPWVATLANNYKVIIYNGQLDLLAGATNTAKYLAKLPYDSLSAFNSAKRSIWRVNNEIAGYSKVAGNLTHVIVRDAGHMVPVDQPVRAYDLIKRLTFGTGF